LAPWGLGGGTDARANSAVLRFPDGTEIGCAKATRLRVAKGSSLRISTGGGGGFGPPERRQREAVLDDVSDGYITESYARHNYVHAFGA
jgi:N-methylhydantoinase B